MVMITAQQLVEELREHEQNAAKTLLTLAATRNTILAELQAVCTHPDVVRRDCYSGHNGDEWVDCTCTVCKKWWTE